MGIRIQKDVIVYYDNAAGYLTGRKAVVDPMFASAELDQFLKRQERIDEVLWKYGVFEQLSLGQRDSLAAEPLKSCRIWQLKPDTDIMMRFISLEEMTDRFGKPDADNYQLVYDGAVSTNELEGIYEQFIMNHPPGYEGHLLSISDVVELYNESGSAFFYCDRIGFKEITFGDSGQSMMMHF